MSVIKIIDYTPEHLKGLIDIVLSLQKAGKYYPKPTHGETLEEFLHESEGAYKRKVLTVGDKIVGHVSVRKTFPPSLTADFLKTVTIPESVKELHEIRRLIIHDDYQGKQLGCTLLNHAVTTIVDNSGSPFLSTTSDNMQAVRFYEKNGWRTVCQVEEKDTGILWNMFFLHHETICSFNPHFKAQIIET
jgi:ribosomal protein S18 acetylase RimI-like enzyme